MDRRSFLTGLLASAAVPAAQIEKLLEQDIKYVAYWADTGSGWHHYCAAISSSVKVDLPYLSKIADLAIWDRKLSPQEIQALAQGIVRPIAFDGGLLEYYPLDGIA